MLSRRAHALLKQARFLQQGSFLLPGLGDPDLPPHISCTSKDFLQQDVAGLSTSAASSASSLKDDLVVVPMPQLSPHMSSGRIRRWLKEEGDEITTYDVIFEVDTESLSEEAYKVGDFAGSVTMLVEVHPLKFHFHNAP